MGLGSIVVGWSLMLAGGALVVSDLWRMYDRGYGFEGPSPWPFMIGVGIFLVGEFVRFRTSWLGTLLAPVVGVTLLAKAAVDGGFLQRWGLTLWGVGLVGVGLAAVTVVRRWRSEMDPKEKKEKMRRLRETGGKARGRVVKMEDTGVTIDGNPRVDLTVSVEPIEGTEPFRAQKRTVVPRLSVPRVGDVLPVWYDPEDRSRWMLGLLAEDTAETRELYRELGIPFPGSVEGPAEE